MVKRRSKRRAVSKMRNEETREVKKNNDKTELSDGKKITLILLLHVIITRASLTDFLFHFFFLGSIYCIYALNFWLRCCQ